jgi:hypothetical protein
MRQKLSLYKLANFFKESFLFLCLYVIVQAPRLINPGSDMANFDSQYWMPRITKFAKTILEKDWAGTYQQYHPGTTLLWKADSRSYFTKECLNIDTVLIQDIFLNTLMK